MDYKLNITDRGQGRIETIFENRDELRNAWLTALNGIVNNPERIICGYHGTELVACRTYSTQWERI